MPAFPAMALPIMVTVASLVAGVASGPGVLEVSPGPVGPGSGPVDGGGPADLSLPWEQPVRPADGSPMGPLVPPSTVPASDTAEGQAGGTLRVVPAVAVSGSAAGIPGNVLSAYRHAAAVFARTQPGCHLSWPLLAAVGKVESGHARGGALDASGRTLSPILGPVLSGGSGYAAIRDTDDGRWDGDPVWDRAVGPMQFIPSSWRAHAADGNGDGRTDPSNVWDATLAAGGYLCSYGRDLRRPSDLRQAIFGYNHSWPYVATVLAWMQAYSTGSTVVTAASTGGTGGSGGSGGPPSPTASPTPTPTPSSTPTPTPTAATTTTPSPSPTVTPTGVPTASPTPSPTPTTCPTPTSTPTPSGTPSPSPTPSPTQVDATMTPTPTAGPDDPCPPDPCAPTPTGAPSPSPTDTGMPTPTPSPTASPSASPTSTPSPTCTTPTVTPTTTPTPTETP